MLSPRGKPEAGADGEATPDRPTMTPRGSSLLGSLGKLLWSPSGGDTPGLKTPAQGGGEDGMMTQATPRSPGTPRSPAPNQASSSSGDVGAPTPGGAEKKGLLDTLFSPVFTLFSGGAAKADEKAPVSTAPPPPPPAPKPAPAPAPAAAADDDDVDEFDPYTFIRSLPPTAPAAALARPVCLPRKTRGTHKISLILDLDETLLHSSIVPLPTYDIVFPVHFNSVNYQVYVRKRPHMDYFMNKVSQWFEIIVFTASQKVYADKLLSIIDPQRKWIKHRVFRDSCVLVDGNYLKDLTILGRDLAQAAIVDNSPQAFGFQLDNGIPIESWFDDPSDTELLKLLPFLESMATADDVRPLIRQQFELHKLVYGS
mmetsp:Transcript_1925/g.4711  ORF Transcript_1925/g.4711 Transcript_1925/m.4711 type:complete len:369 (-) Transcript_1925:272-1378(-)